MALNYTFLLASYDDMGTPEEQASYLDSLENFIIQCREAEAKGDELVPDAVYDTAIDSLRAINPNSPLLKTVWSEDEAPIDEDTDKYLVRHSMCSIQTIKDLSLKEFKAYAMRIAAEAQKTNGVLEMHASMKENGHGIRWAYKYGKFVKAHTRGRSSNGRDITAIVKKLVPEFIPALASVPLMEFRGEVVLPLSNLDKARAFKPDIKSAFSGVAACICDSATDAQISLLKLVAYAAYSDQLTVSTLEDTYKILQSWGFEVPIYRVYHYDVKNDFTSFVAGIIEDFEDLVEDYDCYTDGVVLSVNSLQLLESMGQDGSTKLGNVALKVGFWAQNIYSGVVEEIIWKEGRIKLTPVARIAPVMTSGGATVRNVPLYAPIHILRLSAYPGHQLCFRYGGEAGVVPCFPNGQLITDEE